MAPPPSRAFLLSCQTIFCNPLQFLPSFFPWPRSDLSKLRARDFLRLAAIGKLLSFEGKAAGFVRSSLMSLPPPAAAPPTPNFQSLSTSRHWTLGKRRRSFHYFFAPCWEMCHFVPRSLARSFAPGGGVEQLLPASLTQDDRATFPQKPPIRPPKRAATVEMENPSLLLQGNKRGQTAKVSRKRNLLGPRKATSP